MSNILNKQKINETISQGSSDEKKDKENVEIIGVGPITYDDLLRETSSADDHSDAASLKINKKMMKSSRLNKNRSNNMIDSSSARISGAEMLIIFEKHKLREEMRLTISSKIKLLEAVLTTEYFNLKDQIRAMIGNAKWDDNRLQEEIDKNNKLKTLYHGADFFSGQLIHTKSCDTYCPDLSLLSKICRLYLQRLNASKLDVILSNDSDLISYQNKVSLCLSIIQLCQTYKDNNIWIEFTTGCID
jgi:hypothetical protein